MISPVHEIATARIAMALQKIGWMVGRSYDKAFDLLAYSPKHYRICSIQVEPFVLQGAKPAFELARPIEENRISRCTHLAVFIEPKEWIYIASKEKVIGPGNTLCSVLSPGGDPLDGKDNDFSFGLYRECWEELLC